jgi:hypothetical protein
MVCTTRYNKNISIGVVRDLTAASQGNALGMGIGGI